MLKNEKEFTKLNILFCGDLAPVYQNEIYMTKGSVDLFADVKQEIKKADMSFANLECPLTLKKRPIRKTGPTIHAHPDCAIAIAKAGFQVVGLANNHIMDMGQEGLFDTLKACRQNDLAVCGAGKNLEKAQKILFVERQGIKIAVIAITEHEFSIAEENKAGSAPLDLIDNYHQIQKAKQEADIILMTLHGGNESFPYPRPRLRKVCQYFIDLGVHAVICHHAHTPGAYEYYKKKPIIYSLGNFLFDSKKKRDNCWELGYMVKLNFQHRTSNFNSMKILPYRQTIRNPGILKLKNEEKSRFLHYLEIMRNTLADKEKYFMQWKKFCNYKANLVIAKQYLPILFPGIGKLSQVIPFSSLLLRKKDIPVKHNLITCESHRELLTEILENKLK